jgi:flagellar hook-associated protein 3 FlgL
MISGLNSNYAQFLANLERIQERGATAQRQISSGRRVSLASDDPDQVGGILHTAQELDRLEQIGMNLARVKGEVDTAEQALQGAVKLMDRLRAIGAAGATSTQTNEQRQVLAAEVEAIMSRLVAAANVTYEGRSIFSGDADNQAAFQVDWTQANGVSAYAGRPATRKIEHPSGFLFSVSKAANEIFDAPGGMSVFAAVTELRNALLANDPAAAATATDLIRTSQTHLNGQLAFYGSVQSQVEDGIDFAASQTVRLKTTLSRLRDADLATAIVELNNARLEQDAALGAQSRLPRTSLFDYLG